MSEYNLLEEKWIPVLYHNGEYTRLGIKKTLEDAHLIRQVAASNPMDRVSLIRFLLAVLYWCKGNPPEEGNELPEKFPMEWFKKLDDNRDCFNLLGDGKRFYQYGGYKKEDKLLSTHSFFHELFSTTNIWHARSIISRNDGVCLGCCSIGLIRLPTYTTEGGRGKSPGINRKPPVYVIPFGETLAETLWLSYKFVDSLGTPFWELTDKEMKISGSVSLLTGLSYFPRRVWLYDPEENSQCVICGKEGQVISKTVFEGVKKDYEISWIDPHVVYNESEKEIKSMGTDNPLKPWFKTERPWSNILVNLLKANKFPPTLLFLVGFASDKMNSFDTWERTLYIPISNDQNLYHDFLSKWDEEVIKLPILVKDNTRERKNNVIENSLMKSIRPHIENQISSNIDSIINGIIKPWEFASTEYSKLMPAVASSLSPGYTCRQVERRKVIEMTIPKHESQKDNNILTKIKKGKTNESEQ